MILEYHRGNNFGDKLNTLIFNYYLPNFFNDDKSVYFLGIGTILGLKKIQDSQKIVFSSGATDSMTNTYGDIPKIDTSYDIFCVRGPLTSKLLGISPDKAITDGAALLYDFYDRKQEKIYEYSYIPHVGSEFFFPEMELLCKEIGINYISPKESTDIVLKKISQSKVIIAEAMHGAIVADALRVPWIPVKMYKTVNEFKWRDWTMSLNMDYSPNILSSCFKKDVFINILKNKFSFLPDIVFRAIVPFYHIMHIFKIRVIKKQMMKIKNSNTMLSNEFLLQEKVEILKYKLKLVKEKYSENR